jgi:hypothetical protein
LSSCKGEGVQKNIQRDKSQECYTFYENSKIIDLRTTTNPNTMIEKKTIPRHFIINFLKTSDKRKFLAARGEIHYIQRNKDKNDNRFIVGNNISEEAVE